MIAKVFIDGRYIGEIKYKLPVEEGNQIPLPRKDGSTVEVLIAEEGEAGENLLWASRSSSLERFSLERN